MNIPPLGQCSIIVKQVSCTGRVMYDCKVFMSLDAMVAIGQAVLVPLLIRTTNITFTAACNVYDMLNSVFLSEEQSRRYNFL